MRIHSSIKPPVARLPRELCLAAIISNLLPFLNISSIFSFDVFVLPLVQSNSFLKPGINLQSSSAFSFAIPAACSFSFVILKVFYPLDLIFTSSYKLSINFHPRLTLGLIIGKIISRNPLDFCVAAS